MTDDSPLMVVLVLDTELVLPHVFLVSVQVPEVGRLLNTTVPVDTPQVGCVLVPTTGAPGVTGCVLMTAEAELFDVQPSGLSTVQE
jgi:hypothetical protein